MPETNWRRPCSCGASTAIERAHQSRDWSHNALVRSKHRAEDGAAAQREFEDAIAAVPPHTAACDAEYERATRDVG